MNYSREYTSPTMTKAKDGKPFAPKQTRVVTTVKGKEHFVIYRTHHENPVLEDLFEKFKLAASKTKWLVDNQDRLKKFDIDVANLLKAYTTDWDWKKSKEA